MAVYSENRSPRKTRRDRDGRRSVGIIGTELEVRIGEMESEIARYREAIAARNATKAAAATFFKR
jgi:uncharacterized small protein (DUF1192 family)